jgi:phage-related minor tail protein
MSGSVVGALRVTLGIDTAAFEEGLGIAQKRLAAAGKSLQKVGDSMADLGSKLSVAVTAPLLAAGAAAVKGAQAQAQAMAQVNAALESMGPVAGRTAEQLLKASDALELNSLFDGDEILKKVTANLLTFGNVAGEQFDRAQQAAVDLATRMDTDLQSATILIGKALNDPIKGLTAMGKAGIQFTADQKALIKSMVETGNVAGAQRIILGELEKQFGGAGKAAADTSPWRKAEVAIGQAGDKIGEALLPVIEKVAGFVEKVANAFNNLSPETQTMILAFAGIAAVIGPVLIVLGTLASSIGALAPVFAPLVTLLGSGGLAGVFTALGAAIAPFLVPIAAIAAAGALIYANWDKIAPVLEKLRDKFVEAIGPKITSLIETVKTTLTELWKGPLGEMIRTAVDWIGKLGAAFLEWLGDRIIGIVSAFVSAIESGFKIIGDVFDIVIGLLTGDFSRAWEGLKSLVGDVIEGVINIFKSLFPETAKVIGDLVSGFGTWFTDLAARMITWGVHIIDGLVKGIKAAPEAVWNALKSVVLRGIENVRALLGIASPSKVFMEIGGFVSEGMAAGIAGALPKVGGALDGLGKTVTASAKKMAEEVSSLLDRLFPEVARARKLQEELALLDRAGLNDDLRRRARLRLITEGQGDAPVSAGLLNTGPLIDFDKQLEELQAGLAKTANGAKVQTVQIAESFRDMADKSIQALDRMVSAIKGGDFLDILGSLINLGLQLGSMGVFGKKVQTSINAPQLPGFATGGSFTVGGRPGRDANVVAFRATRGEHVQISTSEAAAINRAGAYPVPGAPMNITVTPSPYFDVAVDGRIVQAAPSVAGAGAALAQSQMEQRARRRVR